MKEISQMAQPTTMATERKTIIENLPICQSIISAMAIRGVTNTQLAKHLDLNLAQFGRMLKGKGQITAFQVRQIADYLESSVDDITKGAASPRVVEIDKLSNDEIAILAVARVIDGGTKRALQLLTKPLEPKTPQQEQERGHGQPTPGVETLDQTNKRLAREAESRKERPGSNRAG